MFDFLSQLVEHLLVEFPFDFPQSWGDGTYTVYHWTPSDTTYIAWVPDTSTHPLPA